MKIKKHISILLIFVTLLTLLAACGGKDNRDDASTSETKGEEAVTNTLLPYGLKFGMSYNQAQAACEGFPSISKASNNDGYFSEGFDPDMDDYYALFGVNSDELYEDMETGDAIVFDPSYYFSFNADKELYEFYSISKIIDSERTAEYLFNVYLVHFEELLNIEPNIKESDTQLSVNFETDNLNVSVVLEMDGTTCMVYIVIHSKEYDLNT